MLTKYTVLRSDGAREEFSVELPKEPGYERLKEIVEPHLDGNLMERVRVLRDDGEYTDMFVDDAGLLKGLPRNEEATRIYRNNWLVQHPGTDPETLSPIVGTAVLFDRPVWF